MATEYPDNGGKSDIVSLSEAAARMGKSERTIRRYVDSGKLSAIEINGRTCIQLAGAETPPARDTQAVTAAARPMRLLREAKHCLLCGRM